ncbi:MAG: DUF4202 domain-containing protein [Verrucomicrobia subdivision 3 bacterium]|nr:DUF4202 domain-containing protein [Limisphaerales bacterium]
MAIAQRLLAGDGASTCCGRGRPRALGMTDPERFQRAIARFDEENAHDPNQEIVKGEARPRELVYAERLTDWVLKLNPNASEELRLAARCQHICRWMIPRDKYERTKAGYLRWRNELKKFHAEKAGEMLREVGYPEPMIARVQALNLKKDFPQDRDSRTLEDALCLVFLEHQFAELAVKTTDDQMINALRKSWAKMTEAARAEALKLEFSARERELLSRALEG